MTETLEFKISATWGARQAVQEAIYNYALRAGLGIRMNAVKGVFVSTYYFTLTGNLDALRAAQEDIEKWARRNGF